MKEIWGVAWFATAVCAIALVGVVFDRFEVVAPAFFCFLPVVFFQQCRITQALSNRVRKLENLQQ